jgi:AcrR family transcriptional regulator
MQNFVKGTTTHSPKESTPLGAHPAKPLIYSSPPILERRERLLKETRRMIIESGYENFSVRKLCSRANVAQRTFYNAFHNKDRVIALAIRAGYDDFHRYVMYKSDPNSLTGLLDRAISVNRGNFRVRNYTKAVVAIYFGPKTPRDVWESLRDMSLNRTREWLASMKESGQVQPWVSEEHFADTMANVKYSTINDWCQNRLSDEEYLPRLAENMLMLVIGSVRGEVREEAERYLADLRATGKVPDFGKPIGLPRPSARAL